MSSEMVAFQSHKITIPVIIRKSWQLIYLCLVTALIALAFANWVYDDPFITYRYAVNLAEGLGFAYNPGQPTLSVTSPLFTLILAGGYYLGFEPRGLAIFLGALSIAAGALGLWHIGQSMNSPAVSWMGLFFYPTFPLLLTTLGSETPLYLAFCLGAIAFFLRKRSVISAALLALAILARPDGLLLLLVLLFYAVLQKQDISWKAGLIFVLILAPWLIFSWDSFGSPVPLTLFAKQAQGTLAISNTFPEGFLALVKSYATQWQWLLKFILAMLGLLTLLKRSKSWAFMIAWSCLYFLGFSLLAVSAYFWYYAPLIPVFLVLTGLGLEALLNWLRTGIPRIKPFTTLAVFLLIANLLVADIKDFWVLRQQRDSRYDIYQAAGTWLQQNTPEDALTAALEIGILGYYAQRPMIDFAGLLHPAVTRQLVGAQDYEAAAIFTVEQYHPDYLVLHQGLFPNLESKLDDYACVQAQILDGKAYNYSRVLIIVACNPP